MEGLGVDSGGVLWPCLATNTCENTGGSILAFAKAPRETRPDAFVFMRGVCLSAAVPRSELLDCCRLPGATVGSLPASRRDGQPTRLLLAASAAWPQAGNGGGFPFGSGSKQLAKAEGACVCCVCCVCCGCSDAKLLTGAPDAFAFRATLWLCAW